MAGVAAPSDARAQAGADAPVAHVRRFFSTYLNPSNAAASASIFESPVFRPFFSKGLVSDWTDGTKADYPVYNANPVTGRQEGSITKLISA